jgi:TP901 family phage tail tape measure protein
MPAEKGIFLDVLPRFDMAALAVILSKVEGMFKRSGSAIGATFGSEAQAAIVKAAEAKVRATNLASDADLRAERAAHAHEVANQRLSEVTKKLTDATTGLVTKNSMLTRAVYANADAAKAATLAQRDLTRARELAAAASEAHDAKVAASAKNASNAMRAFNIAGVAALGGFAYAFADSTKAAGDFQLAMTKLTAAGGESAQNIQYVQKSILQLAGQVGNSAQELGNSMFLVEKAGYRGKDGIEVLTAAAQLANAEGADLNDTIQGLTTSMRDFNIPVSNAADVASKMNVAAGLAKTTLQEFSSALHNVEPTASVAGVKLNEVYAAMARITQSGAGADQASEWLNNTIGHLMNINGPQKNVLRQLGLDPVGLETDLRKPEIGMTGVIQEITNKIRDSLNPQQQVVLDTQFKSVAAMQSIQEVYNKLTPVARQYADAVKSGQFTPEELRGKKATAQNDPRLDTWIKQYHEIDNVNKSLKQNQGDLMGVAEAFAKAFGTDSALKVVSLIAGLDKNSEQYQAMQKDLEGIAKAQSEADGTVKGFNETQGTLNKKLADAKAGFGAAVIELGYAFIPAMTTAANVLKSVAEFMGEHTIILGTLIGSLGLLGGAWVALKIKMLGGGMWDLLKGAQAAAVTGQNFLTTAALRTAAAFGSQSAAAKLAAIDTEAAATKQVASEATVAGSATEASAALGGEGPAALAGAQGVEAAAAEEVVAEDSVTAAAGTAQTALLGVGKVLGALAIPASLLEIMQWERGHEKQTAKDQGKTASAPIGPRGMMVPVAPPNPKGLPTPGLVEDGADSTKADHPSQRQLDDVQTRKLADNASINGIPGDLPEWLKSIMAGTPGADVPQSIDQPSDIYNPGDFGGGKGGKGGAGRKPVIGAPAAPAGTKNDPLYIDPTVIADGFDKSEAGKATVDGAKKTDNIGYSYDPFEKNGHGHGLPGIASLMATFAANLAFGNPYGQLHPEKRTKNAASDFSSDDSDVSDVSNADLQQQLDKMAAMSPTEREEMKNSIKLKKAIREYQKAQRTYVHDLKKYGESDDRTLNAEDSVQSALDNISSAYSGQLNAGDNAAARLAEDQARGVPTKDPLRYQRDQATAAAYSNQNNPDDYVGNDGYDGAAGNTASSGYAGDNYGGKGKLAGASVTYTPDWMIQHGFPALFQKNNPNNPTNIPAQIQQLAADYGLTAQDHIDSTLHGGLSAPGVNTIDPMGSWAFDFYPHPGDPQGEARMENLAKWAESPENIGNIAQLIHRGGGRDWGVAGGQNVGGAIGQGSYYNTGEGYNVHGDHDHIAFATLPGSGFNGGEIFGTSGGDASMAYTVGGNSSYGGGYGGGSGGSSLSSATISVGSATINVGGGGVSTGGSAGTGGPASPSAVDSSAVNTGASSPGVPAAVSDGLPGLPGSSAPSLGGVHGASRGALPGPGSPGLQLPGAASPGAAASAANPGGGAAPQVAPPVTPGGQQMTTGSGKGAGVSGGLPGMAEGAAAAAANAFAPGSGAAVQIATQEANRAVGAIGQYAGIAASGLIDTFKVHDPDGGGSGKNSGWLDKIYGGIAGAHPSVPNGAGDSADAVKPKDDKSQTADQASDSSAPVKTDDANGQGGQNGQKNPQGGPQVNIENYHAYNGDQSGGADLARQFMAVAPTPF